MKNPDLSGEQQIIAVDENLTIANIQDPSEELDYDFDYDPNEMYYALNGIVR